MTNDIVEKILNKYKNYPANHYIKLYIKQVETPRTRLVVYLAGNGRRVGKGWRDQTVDRKSFNFG